MEITRKKSIKWPVLTIHSCKNKSRWSKKLIMKYKYKKIRHYKEQEVTGINQQCRLIKSHVKKLQHQLTKPNLNILMKFNILQNLSIKVKKNSIIVKTQIMLVPMVVAAMVDQIKFHQFEVSHNLQVKWNSLKCKKRRKRKMRIFCVLSSHSWKSLIKVDWNLSKWMLKNV